VVCTNVQDSFRLTAQSFGCSYVDEQDNDEVAVCTNHQLEDALRLSSRPGQPLKLLVKSIGPLSPTAAASASSGGKGNLYLSPGSAAECGVFAVTSARTVLINGREYQVVEQNVGSGGQSLLYYGTSCCRQW
jgi:hypothetical protein